MKDAGFPYLANSTFTMTSAVDDKGGDWSGSTIKFTKQSLDLGRRKLTVEGFIHFIQNPYQQKFIDGKAGFRGQYLPNKRSLSITSANDVKCQSGTAGGDVCGVSEDWIKTHTCSYRAQYYFALLSPDERRLTDGTWSRPLYDSCNPSPGRWEASRQCCILLNFRKVGRPIVSILI
jgi:hypothetical protein